jgi:2-dehydro-3-deoxyphosphooctonate aldolase (KDO 8-P synthase)
MAEPLAKAAVAVGVDALFFETHPDPASSPSDGPNMIPLQHFREVLARILAVRAAVMSPAQLTAA